MEHYSAITKDETMPLVATWIGLEITIHSEVSHTQTDIIQFYLHGESKKHCRNEFISKTEINSQSRNKLTVTKGVEDTAGKLGV